MGLRITIITLLFPLLIFSQEAGKTYVLDAGFFAGSILRHNSDVSHLIRAHPSGVFLSLNRKTWGDEGWEHRYNYPDLGYSAIYQEFYNPTLGKAIGLYAHYNFYMLNRAMQFRVGQGVAWNSNPYDPDTNFRNNAFGSRFLSSTYLMLNYQKEAVWKQLGVTLGLGLVHYSNANFRAPNTSTNTLALNLGVNYSLNKSGDRTYTVPENDPPPPKVLKLNVAFRTGINESDVVGSGQFPFYVGSVYTDLRLGHKSALQVGTDIFVANFLRELIRFQAAAFPEMSVDPNTDPTRAGVFLGHELFINRMSVITQLGYYIYYPFDFEGPIYNRIGMKRYFKGPWFATISLKSHAAKAEAVEFGIGIRI